MKLVTQSRKIVILVALFSITGFSLTVTPQVVAIAGPSSSSGHQHSQSSKPSHETTVVPTEPVSSAVPKAPLEQAVTPQPQVSTPPVIQAPVTPIITPQQPTPATPAPVNTPSGAVDTGSSKPAEVVLRQPTPVAQQTFVTPQPMPMQKLRQLTPVSTAVITAKPLPPVQRQASVVQNIRTSLPVDTAEDVVKIASFQAAGDPVAVGSKYVSNKINPELAKSLLFAGLGTITAGTLMYGTAMLSFKKQDRHIAVKNL